MQADLIQLEIQHLRNQIELLDAMFDEYTTKKEVSYCHSVKNLFNYYYENFLHKLGYCNCKEE